MNSPTSLDSQYWSVVQPGVDCYSWLNANPAMQSSRKVSQHSQTCSSLIDQQQSRYWLAIMTRIWGESCLKRDVLEERRKGGCNRHDFAICDTSHNSFRVAQDVMSSHKKPRLPYHPEEGWTHRTATNIRLGEARD